MKIGDNIQRLRYRAGYTQRELAKRLNVHGMTVHRWENGAMPHPSKVRPLAKALGVSVDELLGNAPVGSAKDGGL